MSRCWLSGFVALLALLLFPLAGQALTATQHGNQLLLDGIPTSLTFAWGCTDAGMLADYRALGFNTLLLRIDSLGPEELEKDVALAQAAADAKMFVLVELANGSWSTDEYADLSNTAYLDSVKYYLDSVIPRLRQNPRLDRLDYQYGGGRATDFRRRHISTIPAAEVRHARRLEYCLVHLVGRNRLE